MIYNVSFYKGSQLFQKKVSQLAKNVEKENVYFLLQRNEIRACCVKRLQSTFSIS